MVVVVVVGVLVAVPLLLGGWLFLTVHLVGRPGSAITASQVLAYMLAAAIAVVFFPVAIGANRRWLWHVTHRNTVQDPQQVVRWGSESTAAVPTVPLGVGFGVVRVLIVMVGIVSLVAICGPLAVTSAIWTTFAGASSGPMSLGALFQFIMTGVTLVLELGVMVVDSWWSRRHPLEGQRQLAHQLRFTWYVATVLSWGISLVVGLIVANMIISYL